MREIHTKKGRDEEREGGKVRERKKRERERERDRERERIKSEKHPNQQWLPPDEDSSQ